MYKFIIGISSSHQLKALIAALYLLCSPVLSWMDHLLKRQTGKDWTYVVESGFHANGVIGFCLCSSSKSPASQTGSLEGFLN